MELLKYIYILHKCSINYFFNHVSLVSTVYNTIFEMFYTLTLLYHTYHVMPSSNCIYWYAKYL